MQSCGSVEFEEKAMNMLAGKFTGLGDIPGCAKLDKWCDDFLTNHPIHSTVTLTQQETDSWFEAMDEFRNYHINISTNNLYVKPIDYTLLPTSLLSLWGLSNCQF